MYNSVYHKKKKNMPCPILRSQPRKALLCSSRCTETVSEKCLQNQVKLSVDRLTLKTAFSFEKMQNKYISCTYQRVELFLVPEVKKAIPYRTEPTRTELNRTEEERAETSPRPLHPPHPLLEPSPLHHPLRGKRLPSQGRVALVLGVARDVGDGKLRQGRQPPPKLLSMKISCGVGWGSVCWWRGLVTRQK